MDSVSIDIVRGLLVIGKTYEEISSELKDLYPHITRGLSTRSVRRYVAQNRLKDLAKKDKIEVVEQCIGEVGYPAYHLIECGMVWGLEFCFSFFGRGRGGGLLYHH